MKREHGIRPLLPWGAAALGALAVGVLYFYDPAGGGFFPRCPLLFLTGLLCPGCGSLRAVHQLLHGNLVQAFRLNPLIFTLLPVAILSRCLPERWRVRAAAAGAPWFVLAVVVAFGVLRNIPVPPFTLLAP